MIRRLFFVGVVVGLVAFCRLDSGACGDKFLRMGRSARLRGYAAVHPASILIYAPARATISSTRQFETLLKRAGHAPRVVPHGTDLTGTIAAARYDVVIAAFADTQDLERVLQSQSSRPDVLPILYKTTPEMTAAAAVAYHCRLDPEKMTKEDALAEIDHLMERRLTARAAAAAMVQPRPQPHRR
jgi:hypothetical protein